MPSKKPPTRRPQQRTAPPKRQSIRPKPRPDSFHRASSELADASVRSDAFRTPNNVLATRTFERQKLERELTILKCTELEQVRELSLRSYWYFFTEVLYPDVWREHYHEPFHRPVADKIQNLGRGEDLWIFLQREARKSHLLTIGRHIWDIVLDPNIRLLLVGARELTVKDFAGAIRSAFEPDSSGQWERFQQVFPEHIYRSGDKQTRQTLEFYSRLRTIALPSPTFRATYLGCTGAGQRCDKLTYDDAVEKRNVTSPDMSRKTLTQMLDLLPLVDTRSRYRNVYGAGTRWAYHDPYGAIIGDFNDEEVAPETAEMLQRLRARRGKIHVVVRHAVEHPTKTCGHCPSSVVSEWPHNAPLSPHDEDAVSILDPVITLDDLKDKLAQYMMDPDLGESLWFHQYENVCKAPKDQKFQDEWMVVADRSTWPVVRRRVLAIDSAHKDFQKPGGDWMVALMGDWNDVGRLCVRHGLRSNRWTKNTFIEQIIAYCQRSGWWPQQVIKEKVSNDSFLSDLRTAFLDQGKPVHVYAVTRPPDKAKADWILEQLQAPYERCEVIYGSACPAEIIRRRRHELLNLGQIAHDDVADTEALFFCSEVRVKASDRMVSLPGGMKPPVLNLYDPNHPTPPPAPPPPSAMEAARQRPRVQRAFAELDATGDNIRWDNPETPSPVYPGDWTLGTGAGGGFDPLRRRR